MARRAAEFTHIPFNPESVVQEMLSDRQWVGRLKSEYDFRRRLQPESTTQDTSLFRGLVAEWVAENTLFSESSLIAGKDKLTQFGIFSVQPLAVESVAIENSNGQQYSIPENKASIMGFLFPEEVPTVSEFKDLRTQMKTSEQYTQDFVLPDMWGGILGVAGLAFPVEVKCYSSAEVSAWIAATQESGAVAKQSVTVGSQTMNLGFDPGKQIDFIDWARERVSLPSLSEKLPVRPVLLRLPKGQNKEEIQQFAETARKQGYGKQSQKIELFIEELPYTFTEIESMSGLLAQKLKLSARTKK